MQLTFLPAHRHNKQFAFQLLGAKCLPGGSVPGFPNTGTTASELPGSSDSGSGLSDRCPKRGPVGSWVTSSNLAGGHMGSSFCFNHKSSLWLRSREGRCSLWVGCEKAPGGPVGTSVPAASLRKWNLPHRNQGVDRPVHKYLYPL